MSPQNTQHFFTYFFYQRKKNGVDLYGVLINPY